MMDDQEELEDEYAKTNYEEPGEQLNDQDDDAVENAKDPLAAAGLEDSDAEDEVESFCFHILHHTFDSEKRATDS